MPKEKKVTTKHIASAEEVRLICAAMENSTDPFFLFTPNSDFLYVNDTTCQALGYSKEQLLQMCIPEVDPNYPPERWPELWQEMLDATGKVTIQSSIMAIDGHLIPVEIRLEQLEFNGKQFGTAFAHDISQQLKGEEELKQARDAALEATRLKSEFLANMSHEIRTPMNGMLGMARMLLQTQLTPRQREFARNIIESGEQLTGIIGEILDFSKIEAGKLDLSEEEFDPVDIIEKVATLFAGQIQNRKLEITFLTPKKVSKVIGDPLRIRQVLVNLVSNAIKFTPSGQVTLLLQIITENASNTVLRFSVKDTGIGIKPKARHEIFKAFTQADGSVARKYGGTGLGLAISQQLLGLMGSQLELESELGKGTELSFNIGFNNAPKSTQAPPPVIDWTGGDIFIIEQNPVAQENLLRQLAGFGIGCRATTLETLPATVDARRPWLFIDQLQWHKITKAHKNQLTDSWHIVLLVTGEANQDDEQVGVESFVRKPLTRNQLQLLLDELILGPVDNHSITVDQDDEFILRANLGLHVLVVEDNTMNRRLFKYLLECIGCQATMVCNGKEALEQLKRENYDAVLMDCHMPEMDGFTATEIIRRNEKGIRHTPIIAVSADATAETRQRCLASGMDDYVAKPIMQGVLSSLLEKWVFSTHRQAEHKQTPRTIDGADMRIIKALENMQGKQGSLLNEFNENFASDSPSVLEAITQHLDRREFSQASELTHQLKGSCAVLGASVAQELCKKLRQAAQDNEYEQCVKLTTAIKKESHRLVSAVRNYQQN